MFKLENSLQKNDKIYKTVVMVRTKLYNVSTITTYCDLDTL